MRWSFVRDRSRYEYLYERITDPLRIRRIEEKSVNWKVLDVKRTQDYYVIRQANAENKYTGNIKIVKKSNADVHRIGIIPWSYSVEASAEDYSYYIKRKG